MTKIEKHVPGTVCWVDLMSTNAEEARSFYQQLFGWSFEVGGPETGHYAIAKKGGSMTAGVGGQPPGASFPSAWTVYFATDNLDTTLSRVRAEGGTVMMGPMDIMEEGRMAMCADPTGPVFGIWQPKRHVGAQLVDEPGAMTWREVATREATKARDFYCRVFGLEPKKLEGSMPAEYYTLHKGPTTVSGVMQMTKEWQNVPPHWLTYFAVADADATCKQVTQLGGNVIQPAFDTPYGRMSIVKDPTAAVFAIIQLPPGGKKP